MRVTRFALDSGLHRHGLRRYRRRYRWPSSTSLAQNRLLYSDD